MFMLKLFLWLRYLQKKKIVLFSIAAVALACTLLIVVSSLFNGFIEAVESASALLDGDIVIYPGELIGSHELLLDKLERLPGVKTAAAFRWGSGGLLHLGKGNVQPAFYTGVEPVRTATLSNLADSLLGANEHGKNPSFEIPGHPEDTGAWVGIGLLAEPNEQTDEYDLEAIKKMIGQTVILTTGTWNLKDSDKSPEDSAAQASQPARNFKRITKKFRIADVFFTGHYWYDQILYLPLKEVNRMLQPKTNEVLVNAVGVRLSRDADIQQMEERVRVVWSDFAKEKLGWQKENIEYTSIQSTRHHREGGLEIIRKQMRILMLILGVICSVGVLLVFCIFYMIVVTRQKDIAIIKSCGTSNGAVISIFLGFGVCVGVAGSAIGALLGYIVIRNINTLESWVRIIFGLKIWRSSVYIFDKIPDKVDWPSSGWIILAAIAASAIGALIPAIVAARTKPVDILRYE
jgi:ABC-type lipoprotein release transport system permease subunit